MEKSRRSKDRKTSSLDTTDQHSWPQQLTTDLMIEIFFRLSLKSIAISRCVSKQWASLLGHSHFRDLRLTRSKARPRILFACTQDNKVFFLSSPQPQPQSPDEISSFAADHHMSFSFDHPVEDVSTSFSGLVCVCISGHRFVNGRKLMVEESVVCNPSTGQSLTIPRMKTRKRTGTVRFFGYDPVEKLHKVLGMIRHRHDRTVDHQVLTLGGGTETAATWRKTECGIPCASFGHRQHLCINGVFYYIEVVSDGGGRHRMIICFDVSSEKFSFVKFPERGLYPVQPGMLDCNGKLALVLSDSFYVSSENIEMWVLQDPERHEWSKLVYVFPPMWNDVVDPGERLEIVGVTGPDEFVMASACSSDPFHVYYCNFEKETVRRAVIQGMGAFGSGRRYDVRTCLNHVWRM